MHPRHSPAPLSLPRRRWIGGMAGAAGAGLAASLGGVNAWAAAGGSTRRDGLFILIFLRGGVDGLFCFAPVADPALASLRPNLSRSVLADGIRLGGTGFAAHPSCKPLADLFAAGDLAFCPAAGTTDSSRSHFQAQDLFEVGSGATRGDSGFLARLADAVGGERSGYGAISFTREIPLALRGAAAPPEVAPLTGSGLRLPEGRALEAIRRAHAGTKSGEAIDQAIATQNDIATAMDVDGAARGAAVAAGFARVAGTLGNILRANRRFALAFIDLGGFDTHANQEAVLSRAIAPFAEGLVVLKEALGPADWARTRVAVMTEFGRTVRENGTQGTDHGHGSLFLLAGGGVGGRMLGNFGGLSGTALNDGRDLRVAADWRALLAETVGATLGVSERTLDAVFPGRPRTRIGV